MRRPSWRCDVCGSPPPSPDKLYTCFMMVACSCVQSAGARSSNIVSKRCYDDEED